MRGLEFQKNKHCPIKILYNYFHPSFFNLCLPSLKTLKSYLPILEEYSPTIEKRYIEKSIKIIENEYKSSYIWCNVFCKGMLIDKKRKKIYGIYGQEIMGLEDFKKSILMIMMILSYALKF